MSERTARLAVILGGALVAGGAFLPWATVGLISLDGMRGDGVFALGLGIAIALLGLIALDRGPSILMTVAIMLLAGLAIVLYVWKLASIGAIESNGAFAANTGTGLYVGLAGSVLAFVATLRIGDRDTAVPSSPPAPPGPLEELAALADQRDAGTISAEDYEQRKREIVDRL